MTDEISADQAIGVAPAEPRAYQPGWSPAVGIFVWAWLLLLAGIAILIYSASLETSVLVPESGSAFAGTYQAASNVINIGLLQKQMMVFYIGLAMSMVGIMSVFVGMAVNKLHIALEERG